jgi:hypothetical protein
VQNTSNAHALSVLPSGDVVGLFDNGNFVSPEPHGPDDVAWTRSRDAGYTADASDTDADAIRWPQLRDVFPSHAVQSMNDWGSCVTNAGKLHVIRRAEATPATFDHAIYDGDANVWAAGKSIPPAFATYASGIVMVNRGEKILLFAFAQDGSLQSLAWDGSSWGPEWRTVLAAGGTRNYLSSTGCGGAAPALVWTEQTSGTLRLVGLKVDSLFP